jgi:hypothetical protein
MEKPHYQGQCKCGWRGSLTDSYRTADVETTVHEQTARVPHKHDADVCHFVFA